MMSLDEIHERVGKLESELIELRVALELERSVEGLRRGLASKARGESLDARKALLALRKELFPNATTLPKWAAKPKRQPTTKALAKQR